MDKDLLYRFFEGRVSKDEKIKIKEWAESSEENNAMLLRERKLFNAMILMSQPHHTNNERRTSKSMHLVYEIMKVACVIALTAGTIIGINSIGKDNKVVAMQTITVLTRRYECMAECWNCHEIPPFFLERQTRGYY